MTTYRFLVVRVGGQEFALPASRVRGMVRALGLTLTPSEPGGRMQAVVWIDGVEVTVMAPHAALGFPDRPISNRSCLLLIDERPEALLVDSVSRFVDVSPVCVRPPSRVRLGWKWRTVLNPDELRAIAA